MSPEYRKWQEVPIDIKRVVEQELRRLSLETAPLINSGFAFKTNGSPSNPSVQIVSDLHTLSEGQRADARKQHSSWHVVLPLFDSSNNMLKKKHKLPATETVERTPIINRSSHRPRRGWFGRRVR